jgi:uncharacterized protein
VKLHPLSIQIPGAATVSALWLRPPKAIAGFVFAHGAGAGMDHPFMQAISEKLAGAKIATLRYQFPYMESHSRRPDRPAVCHGAVRAAVDTAHKKDAALPLIAGGKSFGGRMTSQAQAAEPLPSVVGLAFFGFPWHLAKQPSIKRSEHLDAIQIPMLFMQGARDTMGDATLVSAQIRKRSKFAVLSSVPDADHGFHVPVRSGRTDAQTQDDLVGVFAEWVTDIT